MLALAKGIIMCDQAVKVKESEHVIISTVLLSVLTTRDKCGCCIGEAHQFVVLVLVINSQTSVNESLGKHLVKRICVTKQRRGEHEIINQQPQYC